MTFDETYKALYENFEKNLKENRLVIGLDLTNKIYSEKFNAAGEIYLTEKWRFSNDYNLLSKKISEWKHKAKNESQVKILNEMENALIRIFCYEINQENNIKDFIVKFQHERALNQFLVTQISKFYNESKSLKSQIEFYEKNK